jgi:hypothetical protein
VIVVLDVAGLAGEALGLVAGEALGLVAGTHLAIILRK